MRLVETQVLNSWVKSTAQFSRGGLMVLTAMFASLLWGNETGTDFARLLTSLSQEYGAGAEARGIAWRDQLTALDSATTMEQLAAVNQFFNQRVRYQTDQKIYGVEEFWATPAETLGAGMGDCEDFTIAKYTSLRQLGIPAEQLRLTYAQLKITSSRSQAHMVLAWYPSPNSTPLILDNFNPRILPASQRKDLKPIFSFNSEEVWQGLRTSTSASPSARISQWQQMISRAKEQGILM